MKKLIFVFAMVMLSFSAFSQVEHFKFKGIEINGSFEDFTKKLVNAGFTKTEDPTIFHGKFANDDCDILISTTKNNLVYQVIVVRSTKSSWFSLLDDFNTIKNSMTSKYGDPKTEKSSFTKPYYEGDGYELQAIKKEKVRYSAFWVLDNGDIYEHIGTNCSVWIWYTDSTNYDIYKQESKDSIEDDL